MTRWALGIVAAGWIVSMTVAAPGPQDLRARPLPGLTSRPRPRGALWIEYCATCHNARAMAGGVSFADLDPAHVGPHADRWEKVVRKLKTGTMPPAGMPRPEPAAAVRLTGWLEAELDRSAPVNPGRPRCAG